MARYSVAGRGHKTLRHLSAGPSSLAEIRQVLAIADNATDRRAHWYVVRALLDDGLVHLSAGLYAITPTGEDALADLDAGQVAQGPPRQSVRIFGRAA